MSQIRKILCPTDWSQPSRVALRATVDMARFENAELRLLHVLPPLGTVRGIASVALLGEAIKREAFQKLTALIADLVPPDVKVQPLIRIGEEADEIHQVALECDVVVMSTRGPGALRVWSGRRNGATRNGCPVFVIGPDHAPSTKSELNDVGRNSSVDFPFKQVLWPTDWSGPAERALEEAIAVSQRYGAELLLLHVLEPPNLEPLNWEAGQRAEAEECFRALCERHPEAKSARRLVCRGGAAEEITLVALAEGADLIVMSTHGRTGGKRLALGSVAQNMLRLVPRPVFLVPSGATSPLGDAQTETATHT